jgi:hypothetical protein
MLHRLLDYLARLNLELQGAAESRGVYSVAGALLNLTGPEQPDMVDMRPPGMEGYGLWARVVLRTMRLENATDTLAAIAAGGLERCILPWIPLMHGGDAPGIMEQWKQVAVTEPDRLLRGRCGVLALLFADLARRLAEWKRALEGWNMGESQVANAWRAEGRAEGELAASRAHLLRVLELRFGTSIPNDLRAALQGESDLTELARCLDAAVTANALAEFRAAVQR